MGPRSGKATIVKANLAIAFPGLGARAIDKLARRTWRNIGSVLGEYPGLERIAGDGGSRLVVVDQCGLETYRNRERSAVFVGAHIANWEIMALALAREGIPLMALYGPLQNPHFSALMTRIRARQGYCMLARGQSMRPLIPHVNDGGSLGMLLAIPAKDGIEVPFFGEAMHSASTPARMALRYGCDIVPVRTHRVGTARFRVTVYPALVLPARDADVPDDVHTLAIMRQLHALTEQWIRAQPDQWMCASRRWDKAVYRGYGFNVVDQRA
jgi:KDO2-lipid IV(A) lauroyltransferase